MILVIHLPAVPPASSIELLGNFHGRGGVAFLGPWLLHEYGTVRLGAMSHLLCRMQLQLFPLYGEMPDSTYQLIVPSLPLAAQVGLHLVQIDRRALWSGKTGLRVR
jgi:hypothetical protein